MTRYAYFVDLSICAGCEACTVACQNINGLDYGTRFTKVDRVLLGGYPAVESTFITSQCLHCDEPPCAAVCPTGATYKTAAGPVQVDYSQCIGCQYCMTACPYEARSFDPESHLVKKCTLCYTRMAQGERPACVATCLTGARQVGDLDDPADPIHQAIDQPDVIKIEGTSFYYRLPEGMNRDLVPADYNPSGATWAWQSILQPAGQLMMGGVVGAILVSLAANSLKSMKKEGEAHDDH